MLTLGATLRDTKTPQLLAVAMNPDESYALVAVVKRTYAFASEPAPKLTLSDEQVPIRTLPDLDLHTKEYRDDVDALPPKGATDVVVMGTAHARTPTREILIAVAAGNIARQLRVTGERRAHVGADGAVRFSAAEPFELLELEDRAAYGGYDEDAQDALDPLPADLRVQLAGNKPPALYAYARNPVGRAYFIDHERRRADGALLPRVEDPGDPLTPDRFFVPRAEAWIDAPIPGRLGWVHPARYPRLGRIAGGLLSSDAPTRPIRESTLGDGDDLPALRERAPSSRPHPRFLQGAAPGLAAERLRGDELCILKNLHRAEAELRFSLPGEAPRASIRPPGLKALTPSFVLNTLRFEPDQSRVSLTWVAAVPSAGPASRDYLRSMALELTWAKL
ncbi:MAG TPA: DUF2169 domain-containing protein [Minicystis sp.]|nr:DUF2169 domain-containing protein [Minicystis sp.]